MNYAVITSNQITNVIVWDGVTSYDPGEGNTLVLLSTLPAGAGIGWTKANNVWSPPPSQ